VCASPARSFIVGEVFVWQPEPCRRRLVAVLKGAAMEGTMLWFNPAEVLEAARAVNVAVVRWSRRGRRGCGGGADG
jgi:hypothetical protein